MQGKLKREDCMSFDGFIAYIRLGIQQSVGNGCNVVVKEFTKNNGTTQQGLIVLEPESISHQPYTLTIIIRPM